MNPDEWRGVCLNYFARVETAVSKALEVARNSGRDQKLKHLAGQRLSDLIGLSEEVAGTSKQLKAFSVALERWREIEDRRQFLAHGVASVSHDSKQRWVLLLDLTTYRSNVGTSQRWAVCEEEGAEFLSDLENAFKAMSGQLGHFRKRLEQKDPPAKAT